MTRNWLLGAAALLVAACSGGAAPSGPGDGGEDARREDGQVVEDSGTLGEGSVAPEAGGDDGAEAGAPDAGPDASWIIDVPADVSQVGDNGGPVLHAPVFQSISFA